MGEEAVPSEHPWNTALYWKKKGGEMHLICGGTLISPFAVLTAAHCTEDDEGTRIRKTRLKVVLGKKYKEYEHPSDKKNALFLDVQNIYSHDLYDGSPRKNMDMAILELKTMVKVDQFMPACVDTVNNFKLTDNLIGKVVGWGQDDEDGKQTEVLHLAKIPYISYANCINYLTNAFHISKDKFCSVNEELKTTALQKGDSGSGVVFKFEEKYYVYGITSTAVLTGVTTKITTFTDIRKGASLEFINRITQKILKGRE